jgi:hypothetical protein
LHDVLQAAHGRPRNPLITGSDDGMCVIEFVEVCGQSRVPVMALSFSSSTSFNLICSMENVHAPSVDFCCDAA